MGQKIGLDTSIFIYFLEDYPEYADRVEKILTAVHKSQLEAVFSSIGLIELLTGPKKLARYDLAAEYRETITAIHNLTIAGLNENVVETASDLRAKYSVSTPDAIHLATAIDFGAEKFITNDKNLKKVKEIKVALL